MDRAHRARFGWHHQRRLQVPLHSTPPLRGESGGPNGQCHLLIGKCCGTTSVNTLGPVRRVGADCEPGGWDQTGHRFELEARLGSRSPTYWDPSKCPFGRSKARTFMPPEPRKRIQMRPIPVLIWSAAGSRVIPYLLSSGVLPTSNLVSIL